MTEQSIAALQRFVDHHAADLRLAESALADRSGPEAARRVLAGALNYSFDLLDIFPDQYKGLGTADDGIVLRLAAQQAVAAGLAHEGLARLAAEVADVELVLGDLTAGLSQFVARLDKRVVGGRTVEQILGDRDVYALFAADVERQAQRHKPQPIDAGGPAATRALDELRRMVRHALKKEGIAFTS
ncbi:MAG: hypothetical protein EXR72_22815 [Myxococcales bacterium]|nr:hypothetical protein [Myxococcales bacterium]